MKRLMAGIAFGALVLIILMLLGRIAALREQIAQLHREKPAPAPVVAALPPREAPRPVADQRPVETPAPEAAAEPPSSVVLKGTTTEGETTVAGDLAQGIELEGAVTSYRSAVRLMLTRSFYAGNPIDPLELSDSQRERIAALKAQRDAEQEYTRERWKQIIENELTPEQRAKLQQGAAGAFLELRGGTLRLGDDQGGSPK